MRHWTAEERAKQSALIQNWRPWDKSTGARTPEGKAVSAQNAFKGGLRSMVREMSAVLRDQREILNRVR